MKIKLSQLRRIIKEEANKLLKEGLLPGDRVDSPEKFDMLQPGDSIEINGLPCTVVSLEHDLAELVYVKAGRATRQVLDYRYAYADDPDEIPEEEVVWNGPGAAPGRTRLPPRSRPTPSPYD